MASRVTMTELRGNLGKLVNRAAFGGERIVLVSHGKPVAAIVGLADLERLRDSGDRSPEGSSADRTLSSARELRRRIRRWQEEHGIAATDVVDTLAGLRGGGGTLPPPSTCAPDPTDDALGCAEGCSTG